MAMARSMAAQAEFRVELSGRVVGRAQAAGRVRANAVREPVHRVAQLVALKMLKRMAIHVDVIHDRWPSLNLLNLAALGRGETMRRPLWCGHQAAQTVPGAAEGSRILGQAQDRANEEQRESDRHLFIHFVIAGSPDCPLIADDNETLALGVECFVWPDSINRLDCCSFGAIRWPSAVGELKVSAWTALEAIRGQQSCEARPLAWLWCEGRQAQRRAS